MRGSSVLCGNVVVVAANLREVLKKQEYYLEYIERANKVILKTNGGRILLEINNIPYESAVKLAEGLGLESRDKYPAHWSKWNPHLSLDHDGSADAELLLMEMLKLGIPHTVHKGRTTLALYADQGMHTPPMWTTEKMLEIIRETASRYKKQLESTP